MRLALIHYQFEVIHPFLDGNGRVGRLLVTMLLGTEKLLPQPMLHLSAYFEQHRDEYYELLLAVSQKGKWEQWIPLFPQGRGCQSRDAIRRIDLLLALRQKYRSQLQKARASALSCRSWTICLTFQQSQTLHCRSV